MTMMTGLLRIVKLIIMATMIKNVVFNGENKMEVSMLELTQQLYNLFEKFQTVSSKYAD